MRVRSSVTVVGAGAVAVALAICFAGTGLAARQAQSVWDGVYTTEQAQRGATFYQESCAECHGSELAGGELAPSMVGGEFVWNWNGLSVGDLFERLRVSMPQGEPSSVSRQEKADILAFLLEANEFPAGDTELANRTGMLAGITFLVDKP
jgi:mono/diheme cytochrome c family protein